MIKQIVKDEACARSHLYGYRIFVPDILWADPTAKPHALRIIVRVQVLARQMRSGDDLQAPIVDRSVIQGDPYR